MAAKISAGTSDTLCAPERVLRFAPIQYPKPCYSLCVKAKSQGDETKISAGIARLLEEDQTLSYQQDAFTKEQILSGLGSMHLR